MDYTDCPEDGECSFDIYKKKSLKVEKGDFDQIYLEMVDGHNLVLKFEYKKDNEKKLLDGSYREEIFVELPMKNFENETTDLKSENIFFARWCYCKGQTGYYKINEGSLKVFKLNDDKAKINLKFKISEVPQVITEISETFSIQ
ncbi:hypothetical protein WJN01_05205 [Flavobacteriaceae bacterium SZ-1-7]|uniref:hypothetical protein n=1 Tax=Tamlana sedimenti TaxID=3134126 RepID=UPI003127655E